MKGLPEISLEAIAAGTPFGEAYAAPLALERHLTKLHQKHADRSPIDRELAFLRAQFPTILQPIAEGDLFAGRIVYPLVSFSPEPGGLGYACRETLVREFLDTQAFNAQARGEIEAMLTYWREHSTAARVRAAWPREAADALPSDAWTEDPGVGFPLYRIAGTILDYSTLLRLGLPGLRQKIGESFREDDAARDLERGLLGALEVLENSLRMYAAQTTALANDCPSPARESELRRISQACAALTSRPPETFFEAIQLAWLYALHAGTWNYGRVDMWAGPFLEADLIAARITETNALDLVCSWWQLMKAYENQYNNRVFIGGRGRGSSEVEHAADRFARLAIEATRRVRLNQPQLSLRFHRDQDPKLMDLALTAIGEGCTFPLLYNDDANIPAISRAMRVGEIEAEQYLPYGCGEYTIAGVALASPNAVANLPKALELALHDGHDPIANRQTGPHTGDPDTFESFGRLWTAYASQLAHIVGPLAAHQRIAYQVASEDAVFLFLTALMGDCLARRRPLLDGGVRYLSATLETYGNTNAADALHAIDRLVYQEHRYTLPQVIAACDANFVGEPHATVRRALQAVPKYGNDDDEADAMAVRVHEHVCALVAAQAERVGLHSHLVVIINNWANVILGSHTAASADGRGAGEPFANGNNPAPGADRHGVTAFLNSLTKLRPERHAGAVQNMKFSRELFTQARPKLEALLQAYWKRGGTQAMITVVSPEDLEAAMREPEKWGHLMVRVGGFSARFVDLPRASQEEILKRTCHA